MRRLPPYSGNVGKRLVKSPKIYLRDSGLLHTLLQIDDGESLLSHPKYGGSWEGFVIENLLSVLPDGAEAYFYRTSAGAEIDLVVRFAAELWAIEIKHTTAPKLSRGFHNACEDLQPSRKFVVYGGEERFRMPGEIDVMPLADLMAHLLSL